MYWRLAQGRVFFSVLGPVVPGNHPMQGDVGFSKPHGDRRATQLLCRPVRQRQIVKNVSEEVLHTHGWLSGKA